MGRRPARPLTVPSLLRSAGSSIPMREQVRRFARRSDSTDIVICAHNAPADVDACLKSLRAARDEEEPIILVDDGSDDETAAAVAKLRGRRQPGDPYPSQSHRGILLCCQSRPSRNPGLTSSYCSTATPSSPQTGPKEAAQCFGADAGRRRGGATVKRRQLSESSERRRQPHTDGRQFDAAGHRRCRDGCALPAMVAALSCRGFRCCMALHRLAFRLFEADLGIARLDGGRRRR